MHSDNTQSRLRQTLIISAALCFIGHGAWGLITKAGWLPFFAVVGIPESLAWNLMPIIGTFDILFGILILLKPTRAALLWMALWATWTALLRPLSGTPGPWELFERAGNVAPPLMLLVLAEQPKATMKSWFGALSSSMTPSRINAAFQIARFSLALLLIGHGAFGAFVQKPMLIEHWASIGIALDMNAIMFIGYAEIILGLLIAAFPIAALLWIVLIWKLFSEFLYVTSGAPINIFEFIERSGDYGLPIAMMIILSHQKRPKK